MFEEVCLVCGKHLHDDGQAYCSDDCQNIDFSSPSISSSSSALSSPHLGYTAGGDVPALVPSALGNALKDYRGRDHYSTYSSSASSTSWSLPTDDEEEDPALAVGSDRSMHDSDSLYEGSSKSANQVCTMKPSGLSYARRPSSTNYRSTIPHPQRRLSSGSHSGHVRGVPRSAPIHSLSSPEDDDTYSDYGSSSQDITDVDDFEAQFETVPKEIPLVNKSKRNRNRSSLPAYFSLLQMSSPTNPRSSPMSSSSVNTVARLSPPTPKSVLSTGLIQPLEEPMTSTLGTPRGRRREPGDSRCSRRSVHSNSRSRSRNFEPAKATHSPRIRDRPLDVHLGNKGSVEQIFDWSSAPGVPSRGRTAVRRNSSPPPKMLSGAENTGHIAAAMKHTNVMYDRSISDSHSRPKMRGRIRTEELEGITSLVGAPGYGVGRSGLLHRERVTAHSMRVPL